MKLTSWKRVCILAGSYLGFMIGTGVATGQEILQYYTANGYMIFGTAVVIELSSLSLTMALLWRDAITMRPAGNRHLFSTMELT